MKMAVKKTVDKFKKKKWLKLIAPKTFDLKEIGETPAEKTKNAVGRTVKVSIDEVTGQRKQRHITGKFRVKEVKELNAFTEITGFEINHSYLRRMIRRRMSKIQAIATATTKDGKRLRITAVAASSKKLEKRKERGIRKIINESIEKEISKKPFEQAMQELIFGITGQKLLKEAQAVSRLKKLEITKARLMEGKK